MTYEQKIRRFYAPDLRAATVALPEQEAHHARTVLRVRPGQTVELFDGSGRSAQGTVAHLGRGEMTVDVEQLHPPTALPDPPVHVAFAVPKGKRLDWLLEKCTELAACRLTPVVFERSVAGGNELKPSKRTRWAGHCISAAKQCGLNHLPELGEPTDLPDLLEQAAESLLLVGDLTEATQPLGRAVAQRQPGQAITLLIGPEGGLSDAERRQCESAGALPVRLGSTILRIETAAVALLAGVRAVAESANGTR
ncbi:MAG: RsmE family RNA methyltransferase [Phycisphaerae bacterium]